MSRFVQFSGPISKYQGIYNGICYVMMACCVGMIFIYIPISSHYKYKRLSEEYMNKRVCVADTIYGEVVGIPAYGELVVLAVKLPNGHTYNFAEGQVDLMVKQK